MSWPPAAFIWGTTSCVLPTASSLQQTPKSLRNIKEVAQYSQNSGIRDQRSQILAISAESELQPQLRNQLRFIAAMQ
jgi:hypothetical protein